MKRPRCVMCAETGTIYPDPESAAKAAGVSERWLRSCLSGNRTCGGCTWVWARNVPEDKKVPRSPAPMHVFCIETGLAWRSLRSAARACGIRSGASIGSAIKSGETAGGYHWREASPFEVGLSDKSSAEDKPRGSSFTAARSIICVETGRRFDSIAHAADTCGMSCYAVRRALEDGAGFCGAYHFVDNDERGRKIVRSFRVLLKRRRARCAK